MFAIHETTLDFGFTLSNSANADSVGSAKTCVNDYF